MNTCTHILYVWHSLWSLNSSLRTITIATRNHRYHHRIVQHSFTMIVFIALRGPEECLQSGLAQGASASVGWWHVGRGCQGHIMFASIVSTCLHITACSSSYVLVCARIAYAHVFVREVAQQLQWVHIALCSSRIVITLHRVHVVLCSPCIVFIFSWPSA